MLFVTGVSNAQLFQTGQGVCEESVKTTLGLIRSMLEDEGVKDVDAIMEFENEYMTEETIYDHSVLDEKKYSIYYRVSKRKGVLVYIQSDYIAFFVDL